MIPASPPEILAFQNLVWTIVPNCSNLRKRTNESTVDLRAQLTKTLLSSELDSSLGLSASSSSLANRFTNETQISRFGFESSSEIDDVDDNDDVTEDSSIRRKA